ncbi:unnamed protein product [Withania somnifera]
MGSKKKLTSQKNFRSNSPVKDMPISDHSAKHQMDLEKLNLFTQPFRTLKLFSMAMMQYLRKSIAYLLSHRWCMLFSTIAVLALILLVTTDGPHLKHVEEVLKYLQFGLWWVALGVASSIGLGSGLHTFVLYLGPHIALFTLKAMKCGRVDLKMAPYDTIQFQRTPLWLRKDCSEFGPPVFSSTHGTSVPLSSILPQVQLEAVLWGLGTALGELPPYFISRAASLSGNRAEAMEELDESAVNKGFLATRLAQMKRWFLSHAQFMNFFTILVLASTVFIISVCNNQLLYWVETKLIRMFSFIPGLETMLPKVIAKLHSMKGKYMATKTPSTPNIKVNKWDFSLASVWNGVVTIMLLNFFVKIVNATAQRYLKREQEEELAALKNKSS